MKKILLLLCYVAFMFAACSGDDVIPEVPETPNPDPVIPLTIPSTENLSPSFSPDGGTSKVSFTANVSWSAKVVEQGATWCTVSPASGGAGSHTLTISTVANDTPDSRTATVQLTAGTETKTINITQKQKDALTVTSNKFELPAEGGTIDIEAKSNIEFGYIISEEGKSWISYVETKALKTSHLIFKVAESDSLAVREAKITISGGGLSEEITVIQAAKAPAEFKISQTEVEVGSEKNTFELVITSSIGYEVKPEADWITQTSVTGSNGVYTHTFEVAENASTDSRSGIIVVCNDEQKCIPVTVKQKGAEGLSVSQNEFNVSDEGETIEVKVTGKVDEVSIPVEWIKQESATEGLYKFAVSKNESPDSRSAEITFKNTAQNREVKVKVNQLCGGDIFSISTSLVEVNYGASTFEVTITASMGYEVKSQVDWIKEITSKAVSTNVHVFEISANSSNEAREGVIVVCNDNQECIPIVVKQKGKPVEGEEWKTKEFYHKSLAMRFTADWCGYCPNMATALAEAQKALPDKLEVLSVHASGGLQADASVSLCNNYAISDFPTGLVDGRVYVQNNNVATIVSNVSAAVKETEEKYETITGASWNSSISGNNILLDLKVYLKKAGSYKVTALLVENDIVGYQADYNNGSSNNYVHKDVVRGVLSDALGDAVSITENGQIESFNYSLAIPSGCNKDNLRIVVYIQTQGANGSYYINNCASAKVGKEQQLMVKSNNSGDMEGIVPGEDIPFNN